MKCYYEVTKFHIWSVFLLPEGCVAAGWCHQRCTLMLEVFPFTLFISVKQCLQTTIFVSTKSKKITQCRCKRRWCVFNLWCYHLNCHAQLLCSIKLLQEPIATMPSTEAALFIFISKSDVLSTKH